MYIHLDKQRLLAMIDEHKSFPLIASLLIGFVIAWSIVQPSFHERNQEQLGQSTPSTAIARELTPAEKLHGSAELAEDETLFGEAQAFITPEVNKISKQYFVEGARLDPEQRTPELFVEMSRFGEDYLLSLAVNHFIMREDRVNTDNPWWYAVFEVNGERVGASWSNRFVLSQDDLDEGENTVLIYLVNNYGQPLLDMNNKLISKRLEVTKE